MLLLLGPLLYSAYVEENMRLEDDRRRVQKCERDPEQYRLFRECTESKRALAKGVLVLSMHNAFWKLADLMLAAFSNWITLVLLGGSLFMVLYIITHRMLEPRPRHQSGFYPCAALPQHAYYPSPKLFESGHQTAIMVEEPMD